jgi:hypothetical protein
LHNISLYFFLHQLLLFGSPNENMVLLASQKLAKPRFNLHKHPPNFSSAALPQSQHSKIRVGAEAEPQ